MYIEHYRPKYCIYLYVALALMLDIFMYSNFYNVEIESVHESIQIRFKILS